MILNGIAFALAAAVGGQILSESGDPVPFANVILDHGVVPPMAEVSPSRGVIADADGRWRINGVSVGANRLRVASVQIEPWSDVVSVPPGDYFDVPIVVRENVAAHASSFGYPWPYEGVVHDSRTQEPLVGVYVVSWLEGGDLRADMLPPEYRLTRGDLGGTYTLVPKEGTVVLFWKPGYQALQLRWPDQLPKIDEECSRTLVTVALEPLSPN